MLFVLLGYVCVSMGIRTSPVRWLSWTACISAVSVQLRNFTHGDSLETVSQPRQMDVESVPP